jgi:16S rRNA (uracil1498-N3)-methyltransferase
MKKIHWFTDKTIPKDLKTGDSFEITDKELMKQIYKVLKLQKDESIVIKNEGFGYEAILIDVSSKNVVVSILDKKENNITKKCALIICIPKKDKFELILEKCTEIGITDFYPVISDRTIKTNINSERALKIIQEASEQAQRLDTPTLHTISKLEDILDELKPIVFDVEGKKWCHPGFIPGSGNTKNETPHQVRDDSTITFLIGPEGGFSEKELKLFREKKLEIYKLGNTVLKTETAAIVVSGLLLN